MKIVIPLQFLLVCLFILGASVLLGVYFVQTTEGFQTLRTKDSDIQLQACPSGSETYTRNNELLCCRGDIVNEMCNGMTVCSLTNKTDSAYPSCVSLLKKELNQKSIQFCPPSLPNYFEDKASGQRGCTSADRTVDGKRPKNPRSPQCRVYPTENENITKPDSCRVVKKRDTTVCPGRTRPQIQTAPQTSGLISCSFSVPPNLVPRTCYEDSSFKDYLQFKKLPILNNKDFKLSFCSVAKRYYIDKSITDAMLPTVKV